MQRMTFAGLVGMAVGKCGTDGHSTNMKVFRSEGISMSGKIREGEVAELSKIGGFSAVQSGIGTSPVNRKP